MKIENIAEGDLFIALGVYEPGAYSKPDETPRMYAVVAQAKPYKKRGKGTFVICDLAPFANDLVSRLDWGGADVMTRSFNVKDLYYYHENVYKRYVRERQKWLEDSRALHQRWREFMAEYSESHTPIG